MHKRRDILKWLLIALLFFLGVGLNFYFAKIALAVRLLGWVLIAPFLAWIAYHTEQGQRVYRFAQQARVEVRKVIWPSREETVKVALTVVGVVIVVALLLWGIDSALLVAISWFSGS